MPHSSAARIAFAILAVFLMYTTACDSDSEANQGRAFFAAGANKERGVEVLNPTNPDLPFYYSFGTIPYGKQFSHTFVLKNLEDRAITILRTEPACSCSRVKSIFAWSGSSEDEGTIPGDLSQDDNILRVEAGQTFSMQIMVDTARVNPNAPKMAVLRVYTDSPIDPFLTFEINFLPEKLFELASPALRLGDIPLGGGVGNTLQIFSRYSLNQARLIDVFSTTEGLSAEVVLIPGFESNWNLNVTTDGQEVKGPLRGTIILRTTDGLGQGDAGRLEVPVEGRVVPAVMMYPSNLSFGLVPLGESSALQAAVQGLAPGHRIQITNARIDGPSAPYLTVELERIAEDTFGRSARIDVRVVCKEDAPAGAIDATLTLDLVDESRAAIIRKIHGIVQ